MEQKSQQQSEAARKFWEAFKACVEENRVRPDRSGFYEKGAQTLVDFLPEKWLREGSQEDTEPFLGLLAKRPLASRSDRSGRTSRR